MKQCKKCRGAATITDQNGAAWCEAHKVYHQIMTWGHAHKYPVCGPIYSGSGAWGILVAKMTEEAASALWQTLQPAGVTPVTADVIMPAVAVKPPKPPVVVIQGHVTGCYRCGEKALRADRHGRLWCVEHEPYQSLLAPGVTTWITESPRSKTDKRYIGVHWYKPDRGTGPASQGLDYALDRDYKAMGLRWYTDELLAMFQDRPDDAIAWVEACHKACETQDNRQLKMQAAIINASTDTPSGDPQLREYETLSGCYLCAGEIEMYDVHGRPWCIVHVPSPLVEDVPTVATIIEFTISPESIAKSVAAEEPEEEIDWSKVDLCKLCSRPAVTYGRDGTAFCAKHKGQTAPVAFAGKKK